MNPFCRGNCTVRWLIPAVGALLFGIATDIARAAPTLPLVSNVEQQPLVAATRRLVDALQFVGAPLKPEDQKALRVAMEDTDAKRSVRRLQEILDPYCLLAVTINPESRVSVVEGRAGDTDSPTASLASGPAKKELMQQGWRAFLIKVQNQAGITPELKVESPNAAPLYMRGHGGRERPQTTEKLVPPGEVSQRFLEIAMFDKQPLKPRLSGLAVEYRIIELFSRDAGQREASIGFNVGQGTQDIGFRDSVPILFRCVPAVDVVLRVKDFDGQPTTAAFVVRDKLGRIYPNPARRLAPDFFFHNQVYRSDGESLLLPPGEYTVECSRGPEYLEQKTNITVKPGAAKQAEEFHLNRWIHPAERHWYSGDHHVHAAGCAHYDSPTEGVSPADMMRHILGEDLNVGCVLSWGPCWYTQKKFFEGKVSALSKPNYLMRYDIEVSGFPSSHAGHLCLLRLKEDDYPGTTLIEEWPSWTQPILAWGKEQGAVVGYSHSGWGLELPDYLSGGRRRFVKSPRPGDSRAADTLPDYEMPKFDGIGANEFIVTAPNGVCDFISAVDTPPVWELNIWYHTLNCGLRSRISGETDFPCIYGEKVGLGRVYVKMLPHDAFNYDSWILGVRDGRSYCGDGRSHVFDLKVNGVALGEPGSKGKTSQLDLDAPGKVKVTFDVAARLEENPTEETERIRHARLDHKPYWHIERARIGDSRKVPVELIVDGRPAAREELVADGMVRPMNFEVELAHSSWIAVRIFPSVHTNPIFVEVGGKPIRASRKSAEWCAKAVDVCWHSKKGNIRSKEQPAAKAAYDAARAYYQRILKDSVDDRVQVTKSH